MMVHCVISGVRAWYSAICECSRADWDRSAKTKVIRASTDLKAVGEDIDQISRYDIPR
jgi:hypothetical protein